MRNNYGQPTWGKVHGLVDEDFLSYTLSLLLPKSEDFRRQVFCV
jgi:hypothetical protein